MVWKKCSTKAEVTSGAVDSWLALWHSQVAGNHVGLVDSCWDANQGAASAQVVRVEIATQPPRQLDVLDKNSNPPRMDGTQLRDSGGKPRGELGQECRYSWLVGV